MKHSSIFGYGHFIALNTMSHWKCLACGTSLEYMHLEDNVAISWCETCECQIILNIDKDNKIAVMETK